MMVTALLALLAAGAAPATVPVGRFDSVQLNGGGRITLGQGPAQRVTITSGSTEFTEVRVDRQHRLVVKACNQRCPKHYRLEIEVVTPRIDALSVNGGGEIVAAQGFPVAASMAAAVHGGGSIDLRALKARDMAAAVTGGGVIRTFATDELAVAVTGGGEVLYWGDPSVSSAIRGGGRVRPGG